MHTAPRILVVDDEPKICDFLETLLQREGYCVETGDDPVRAVERIREGEFDLIISDIKMPGIDGFELARRAREINNDIPIVIITGYATLDTAIKALREGVDDYITKPFRIDEMRKVVSRSLEKARLKIENRRLMADLKTANEELTVHRASLQDRVRLADAELRRANSDLQRHVKNLAMINEIGVCAASELDLDKLLERSVALIADKLGVARASILIREDDTLSVRACVCDKGEAVRGKRIKVGEGIAGAAAEKGESILIKDIFCDSRFSSRNSARYSTGSLICQPLNYKQTNLGVLCVTDRRSGAQFNQSDLELLSTIANQIAPSIENAALYRKLEESSFSSVRALVAAVEAKDRYTCGHSLRVTNYALEIGGALGLSDEMITVIERAAQLHDLGKLGIVDQLLNKPARLTSEEYDVIKQHPVVGEQIIEPLRFLKQEGAAIRHHHERPDGKGYPDGLAGEDINMISRILSVADAFDAMTSPRPYRPAKTPAEAVSEIESLRGLQFDGEIADIFCRKIFPERLESLLTVQ